MQALIDRQEEILQGRTMLNNRYTLGEKIGEGGLSGVYEAIDIYSQYFEDKRDLVIKLPLKEIVYEERYCSLCLF